MPADPTWSPSEKSGWSLLTRGVPSISSPPLPLLRPTSQLLGGGGGLSGA